MTLRGARAPLPSRALLAGAVLALVLVAAPARPQGVAPSAAASDPAG